MSSASSQNRKDLKRAYKEAPDEAGIWLIRNLKNGKVLLGETLNLTARLNRHRFILALRKHDCSELQSDWDHQAGEGFSFEKAELLKKPEGDGFFDVQGELKQLEKAWLDKLKPYGEKGYHPAE
jgi:hypothetical protein